MSNTFWKTSFCNSKSTRVSFSDPSKYSMSNYEAYKNMDREPHPAINFKRKLTNECAQRGTAWHGWWREGQYRAFHLKVTGLNPVKLV